MKNIFLALTVLTLSPAWAQQNLIQNSGFESNLTGWTKSGASSVILGQAQSGRRSLRSGTGATTTTQNITITPQATYHFTAWAKLGTMSVSSKVAIVLKTKSGGWLDEIRLAPSSTAYRQVSKSFVAPTDAEVAQISIVKDAGASYLFVDELSLIKTAEAPSTPPTTPPVVTPPTTPTEPPVTIPPVVTVPPVTTPDTNGYLPVGVGGGGAMSGVSISPYANLWFVGTDMGTLFKSTDLGQSWRPINHLQATFSSELPYAVSPGFSADGVTVFHAAGGKTPRRSLNSGDTFQAMTMALGAAEYIKYWVSDRSDANRIYAATTAGLWRTSDKGASWSKVASVAGDSKGTFIDQAGSKTIYHANGTNILVSYDNGANFSNYFTPAGVGIRQFTGGRDASGITLAFGDNNGAQACQWSSAYLADWGQTSITENNANCGYVWVNKAGVSFERTSQTVGDHLKMAENDASTIYTTGARAWIRQYGTKVHVSRDKGDTWTLKLNQINWDVNPYAPWPASLIEYSAVALDVGWWDSGYESFAINPLDSRIVAGTGYFFLHSSMNMGENWHAAFTQYADTGTPAAKKTWRSRGLEVITVYRTKFHPTNPNLVYAAAADIAGLMSQDRGQTFRITKAAYNSHYDYAFDTDSDQVVYTAVGNQHDYPNEWYGNAVVSAGGIFRSADRGLTYTRLTPASGTHMRQYLSVGYDTIRNHIYAGSQEIGIVRSTDNGATWAEFNPGLPAGAKIIPQIEVDPSNGNVYALLTGDAPTFSNQAATGIYFLDVANGATSWKLLRTTVNYPPTADAGYKVWYYPTAFAIDFKNPNTLWLVDYENNRNWLMTGVWKSTDRGVTWNRMKQITHATGIALDPKDSNKVHVSGYYDLSGGWGEGGQLSSPDGGVSWFKNTTPALQRNARGVTVDPSDSKRLIYSYFGGGMLVGPNPHPAP